MKFNLATVFETVSDAVPDLTALSYEGKHLTYADFDRQATQVGTSSRTAAWGPTSTSRCS